MNKLDRYKILINHLKSLGVIENQQDLGRKLGYNNSSAFSQVINGKVVEPKQFMQKLEDLYPPLNIEWLESGEGDMLKDSVVQTSRGNNSPNINGNGNHVQGTSALLDNALELQRAALTEISEMRKLLQEQVRNNQKQARSNQEQFNRLTNIIESLTRKD